jgi:dienelactone hydrolase
MLIPDLLLLAAVLALAAWRLIAPAWRPRLRIAAAGLGLLLAAAQWALCGFTWQDLPAWLLLALSALPPVRSGAVLRWTGRLGLIAIAVACIGVWMLPAVPTLPPPDGRYAVATQVYRWTDPARDEPHTADPKDRRSVIAQAWYPTTRGEHPGSARLPYIDGTDNMPGQVSVMPGFLLRRYGQIDTHAEAMAPLAPGDRPWPVVIFSPGYGASRAVYTGLATRLASRGFVVFVLDHPYESAVTQLPDGRVVGTIEPGFGTPGRVHYMTDQQVVRTADIRFVIDQLARPGALSPPLRGGRINAAKVAVIGHSFGGAVSAMAMSEDPRVVAAANIDGTPYGDLPDRKLTRPFLLLQSDLAESPHGDQFLNGNGKLLATMTAPGFRYEIRHANHFSFTDAPFFFAPPGRWLLAQAMGGERGPAATQQAAANILAAFLSGPLTGKPGDPAATAALYPDISGGPVKPESGVAPAPHR